MRATSGIGERAVRRKQKIQSTAEAMIIPEGESGELETNWAASYGTLPKGRYRLVKGFFEEDPNAAGFTLAAEFEIK